MKSEVMLHFKINNTRDDSYVKKGRNHDNFPYVSYWLN